jgi:hypothetical protein
MSETAANPRKNVNHSERVAWVAICVIVSLAIHSVAMMQIASAYRQLAVETEAIVEHRDFLLERSLQIS